MSGKFLRSTKGDNWKNWIGDTSSFPLLVILVPRTLCFAIIPVIVLYNNLITFIPSFKEREREGGVRPINYESYNNKSIPLFTIA